MAGRREPAYISRMTARIATLYQYPIKGFSPQPVESAPLKRGSAFPGNRLFAVENGPSGFDPADPGFISKSKYAVLAQIPEVARARTVYDVAADRLDAEAPGVAPLSTDLKSATGKTTFADWLTVLLGDAARGPLRVVEGPGWRFLDDPLGHVSMINLASVRDLATRMGRDLDPLRFRANLYVEGLEPWVELDWAGKELKVGAAPARAFGPIVRCAATNVDPITAVRDADVPAALHQHFGHMYCGVYLHILWQGAVSVGDEVTT